jgi:hypothetical protein
MKLIELLKGNLGLSEGLNSSTESNKKICKAYSDEICIQKNIADNSNMLMPGFTELTNKLRKISPNTIISMRFIDSNNWAGRIFFDEEKN